MDATMELYFRKCKIKGLAHKSIENYRLSLSTFKSFYTGSLDRLTQDDIDDYKLTLMEREISLTTVNNRLRDLRCFINWLKSRKIIVDINVSLIKQNEPEILALSNMDLQEIYEACNLSQGFCHKRNYMIMRMLEETGLRITECLKIRVNDLNLKESTIYIPETKNRKNRVVYYTPGLAKEIKLYLEVRQNFLSQKGLAATSLFCNQIGGELNISTIQDAIHEYGELAGIKNVRVSAHTFRHTFAKNFLLNGGDIFTLKDILGHSSFDMVYRYARLFSNERHQKYSEVMAKYTRSKKFKSKYP